MYHGAVDRLVFIRDAASTMPESPQHAVLPPRPIRWYQRGTWLLLICLLLVSVIVSASTGAFAVGGKQVVHILLDKVFNGTPGWWVWDSLIAEYGKPAASVIWQIRLPRILLGAAVGGLTALSAVLLQGAFRNPLADPGLIGISSGGAWFALLVSFASFPISSTWTTPVAAFAGCLIVTVVLWRIASRNGTIELMTLILSGVAIQAMLAAAIGLTSALKGDVLQQASSFWSTGGLAQARWDQVRVGMVVLLAGWTGARFLADRLNVFALGDRTAAQLGIGVQGLRWQVVVLVALLMGVAVAYAGAIAFVGLIVPQVLRAWLGPDHRRLLLNAPLAGAMLVVLADLAARTVAEPVEVGLGMILAIVGGPLFILILLRVRRQQESWS
jgi:iron complex transport system permease protein